jgi:hypothetical protein
MKESIRSFLNGFSFLPEEQKEKGKKWFEF